MFRQLSNHPACWHVPDWRASFVAGGRSLSWPCTCPLSRRSRILGTCLTSGCNRRHILNGKTLIQSWHLVRCLVTTFGVAFMLLLSFSGPLGDSVDGCLRNLLVCGPSAVSLTQIRSGPRVGISIVGADSVCGSALFLEALITCRAGGPSYAIATGRDTWSQIAGIAASFVGAFTMLGQYCSTRRQHRMRLALPLSWTSKLIARLMKCLPLRAPWDVAGQGDPSLRVLGRTLGTATRERGRDAAADSPRAWESAGAGGW